MKIKFDPKKHIYTVENHIVPSVNQILETVFGCSFPANSIYVQRACEKGTFVHRIIEEYIKHGIEPSFDIPEFNNFLKIQKEQKLVFNKSEVRLYNNIDGMEYCGTADAVATKQHHITDFKTGSTIRKKHWQYQLSFYAHAKKGIKEISVMHLHDEQYKYISLEILPKEEITEVLKEFYRKENK